MATTKAYEVKVSVSVTHYRTVRVSIDVERDDPKQTRVRSLARRLVEAQLAAEGADPERTAIEIGEKDVVNTM